MADIAQAVQGGNKLEILRAIRDTIADQLDEGVAARDLAALTKRLMDVIAEITQLEEAARMDPIQEASNVPDEPY